MVEHRKFLRSSVPSFPVGDRFPDTLQLMPEGAPVNFSWMEGAEHGVILFVLSSGCEACNLDPAIETMRAYPEIRYGVLAECSEEELTELEEELAPLSCHVLRCEIGMLAKQTPIKVIPYMIAFGPGMGAVASGLFNTYAHAERMVRLLQDAELQRSEAER